MAIPKLTQSKLIYEAKDSLLVLFWWLYKTMKQLIYHVFFFPVPAQSMETYYVLSVSCCKWIKVETL
jgi:hypothetical protein